MPLRHRLRPIKNSQGVRPNRVNNPGHSEADMIVIAIEQVLPKEDPLLRKTRESYWINQYQSVDHGANLRS